MEINYPDQQKEITQNDNKLNTKKLFFLQHDDYRDIVVYTICSTKH